MTKKVYHKKTMPSLMNTTNLEITQPVYKKQIKTDVYRSRLRKFRVNAHRVSVGAL